MDNLELASFRHRLSNWVDRYKVKFEMALKREKSKGELILSEYFKLDDDEKSEFLKLLGQSATAEKLIEVIGGLSQEEFDRLSGEFFGKMAEVYMPGIVESAIEIVMEAPDITNDELRLEVVEKAAEAHEKLRDGISKAERNFLKRERDRKPDPEIIKRNVKICILRNDGFSQGQLAKKFDVSATMIRKIEKEELKWRRLADRLD